MLEHLKSPGGTLSRNLVLKKFFVGQPPTLISRRLGILEECRQSLGILLLCGGKGFGLMVLQSLVKV